VRGRSAGARWPGRRPDDEADEDAAIRYAIPDQRDRRNLTNADLMRFIEAVDRRKTAGRPEKLASTEANFEKSAEQTARIVGTSRATVERARAIIDHAEEDPAIKEAVLRGRKSIAVGAR
jgi:hypothetical protein